MLSPGSSCREIVRRVERWWQEHIGGGQRASTSTSAYCQARARRNLATLESIRTALCWNLERRVRPDELGLAGQSVKIVDDTCF